ncbi:MAG: Tad domain-containing protein [Alphaproteobacteria bacterium]|nr:Tad domain-containing protein [Alphaproteobacteria bacterium]
MILQTLLRRLLRTSRGTMATTFSLTILPIVLTVGGAIDFSRSVHFRAELQAVSDSAALAAAALWQGGTTTAATTAATNYVTAGASHLPPNNGVTQTIATSSSSIGYSVDLTLTASLTTTFLTFIIPTISVTVYSTALNPNPYGHFCQGAAVSTAGLCGATSAFSASAADTNKIYWYYVPSDGSAPADAAMTLLWSNASGSNVNPAPIPLTPSQQVGFAFRNTTGNYGTYQSCTGSGGSRRCTTVQNTNQYGAALNSTHTAYSHLHPPTNSTNGYNSTNNPSNVNSINGTTGKNCSLQVTVNNSSTGAATAATYSGSCPANTDAVTSWAAPTCSALGSKVLTFYFNDMGGTSDDRDFNDAIFTYYCGGNGTGAGGSTGSSIARSVILTK